MTKSNLSELVKARVDEQTKQDLVRHCGIVQRSEGAVVRQALREFLNRAKKR